MIDDAFPWREQLLRSAGILERRKSQRRWTERTAFLVERDIMMGCYGIRKLAEAHKVSEEVVSRTWAVSLHPLLRPRPPDIMSRDKPWDYYNLAAGHAAHLGIKPLCNQVIHSYVWTVGQVTTVTKSCSRPDCLVE